MYQYQPRWLYLVAQASLLRPPAPIYLSCQQMLTSPSPSSASTLVYSWRYICFWWSLGGGSFGVGEGGDCGGGDDGAGTRSAGWHCPIIFLAAAGQPPLTLLHNVRAGLHCCTSLVSILCTHTVPAPCSMMLCPLPLPSLALAEQYG